jgi:hypothetical protein
MKERTMWDGLTLSDYKTDCKATVVKAVCGIGGRQTDQLNTLESP